MRPSPLFAIVVGTMLATSSAPSVVAGSQGSSPPSQVAWALHLPDDASVVEAGSNTALVLTDDGVVAVDALTGDVRWTRPAAVDRTLDVLATPDGLSALVVEVAPGRTEVIGVDTIDGSERFRVGYPTAHQFFPTGILIHPRMQLSVTDDAFVFLRDATHVVVSSLDSGDVVSVVDMPADCSVAASWWGAAQATAHGVIVPCADPTSQLGSGGYVFLQTPANAFTWRAVVPGLVSDPLAPPQMAADGMVARLRFWQRTQGGGGAVQDAVIEVSTGLTLAAAQRMNGILGHGRTWLDTGELAESDSVVLTDLDSGTDVVMTRPCPAAQPVLVVPSGVLWLASDRIIGSSEPPCGLMWTMVDGAIMPIPVDEEFDRRPTVVVVGETLVLHAWGRDLVGIR